MHAELGYYPMTNDLNSGKSGVHFEYGTNDSDEISKFLNSMFNDSEDYFDASMNMDLESEAIKNEIVVKEEIEADSRGSRAQVSSNS